MRLCAVWVMIGWILLTGCASTNLQYSISLTDVSEKDGDPCTLSLKQVVESVVKDSALVSDQVLPAQVTIRGVQIALERKLEAAVRGLTCATAPDDRTSLGEVAVKWLGNYAFEAGDPDQDLRRFEEYLRSRRLVAELITSVPVRADESRDEVEGLFFKEAQVDAGSQWCGSPRDPNCRHQLYYTYASRNDLLEHLSLAVKEARSNGDRDTRFLVLGYEIPWDGDYTLIRYGISLYFMDTLSIAHRAEEKPVTQTVFLGYTLDYANEAMVRPLLARTVQSDGTIDEARYAREREHEHTHAHPSVGRQVLNATGYPFALAIGVKNAVFETVKMPFSAIAGMLFGRDEPYLYPMQNLRTGWNALTVEAGRLPSYHLFSGMLNLLAEVPFVGQVFQLNTGPEHMDWDALPDAASVRHKIFLSRGIYGGDKWGQDTGLWAALAYAAYPDYDIYSPAYRHGTVTDVVWSMFNLSHGPGYNEALYVMRHAGTYDRLYLSGHSGGVQRSASASRILANHGYSVQKVLGIAGPSVGQAYVDDRFKNAFRIFLNAEGGNNQDVTSKVGIVAGAYAGVLDMLVIGPPKYLVGGFMGLFGDQQQTDAYALFDSMGSTNATLTQVKGKVSTLHQTPLRQSFAEPIVFDAYVRSEFLTAFRGDLERPSGESERWKEIFNQWFGRDYWDVPGQEPDGRKQKHERYEEERRGAFPWQRLGH